MLEVYPAAKAGYRLLPLVHVAKHARAARFVEFGNAEFLDIGF